MFPHQVHKFRKLQQPPVLCQCGVLKEKLDSLLKTLNEESQASTIPHSTPPPTIAEEQEEVEGVVPPLPPPLHHHHHPPPHHTPCSPRTSTSSAPSAATAIFKPREQLMLRANSLKKAIRQIIEHTEKGTTAQRDRRVRQSSHYYYNMRNHLQSGVAFRVFLCVFMCSCGRAERSDPTAALPSEPWRRRGSGGGGRGGRDRGGQDVAAVILQCQTSQHSQRSVVLLLFFLGFTFSKNSSSRYPRPLL